MRNGRYVLPGEKYDSPQWLRIGLGIAVGASTAVTVALAVTDKSALGWAARISVVSTIAFVLLVIPRFRGRRS